MQFTSKLTEADLDEVRKIARPSAYWMIWFRIGTLPLFAWILTTKYSRRAPDGSQAVLIIWVATAAIILLTLYTMKRTRTSQLAKVNAARPDQISLSDEGVKYDGPNGATSLVPWVYFKGWREGRRVVLIDRSDGSRHVVLPVAQLSDAERQPIRQFLQSHIASLAR
jgi:hypothetical protein